MAKRRSKIPKPELQLKLVFVFLAVSLTCVLLQHNLLSSAIANATTKLPGDGLVAYQAMSEVLKKHLFLGVALIAPLTVAVGLLVTFRIAGPVYRFEEHLRKIAAGGDPGPCMTRGGDELVDLCDAINAAVDTLKQRHPQGSSELEDDSAGASEESADEAAERPLESADA